MSALCLVIKKEKEEDCQEVDHSSPPQNVELRSEFVNIKMEVEIETPEIRVKEEPQIVTNSSPSQDTNTTPSQPTWDSQDPWRPGLKLPDEPRRDWLKPGLTENEESWHRPVTFDRVPKLVDVKTVPVEFENGLKPPQSNNDTNMNKPDTIGWKVSPDGQISCIICDKTYTTSGNCQRHYLTHSLVPHTCSHCHKEFRKPAQLERHLRTHGTYDCDVCGKVFKTSSNLFQHKRIHMVNKPFKCPLCGKDFAVKAHLAKHQGKSRCKPNAGPIVCHVCDKEFKTEFLLKSHARRHTSEKPYNCDDCDMNFKYKSTLMRHILIHNGVKPFSCEVCNKTFTHISLLRTHMRKHTGEKPFTCPICSKSFGHKHNMERHAIRHSKEKKTTCEVCNKKFPKESRLKYHMRTHINEKYFCCFVCPKKFSHRQNVIRHYSRKHPNATYDCKDTDAKIATKLWEDAQNKKIKYESKVKDDEKRNDVEVEIVVKCEVQSDPEEILPDVNMPQKDENITKIIKHSNDEINDKYNDGDDDKKIDETVKVKIEVANDSDSDNEVLAKKVIKRTEIIKDSNGNEHNSLPMSNDHNSLPMSNDHNSLPIGNESENNIQITIKKEFDSDNEETSSGRTCETNLGNLLVEIKSEPVLD